MIKKIKLLLNSKIYLIKKIIFKKKIQTLLTTNKLENNEAYNSFETSNENLKKLHNTIITTIESSIKKRSNIENCYYNDSAVYYDTCYNFNCDISPQTIKYISNYFKQKGYMVKIKNSKNKSVYKELIISWDFTV